MSAFDDYNPKYTNSFIRKKVNTVTETPSAYYVIFDDLQEGSYSLNGHSIGLPKDLGFAPQKDMKAIYDHSLDMQADKAVSFYDEGGDCLFHAAYENKKWNIVSNGYHDMVVKASAEIAPYLPKGADKEVYLAIAKEHPKAVLALATIGKAIENEGTKSAYQKLTITSPEDLVTKCQHENVVSLSDELKFSDIKGSIHAMYEAARPMIGLGERHRDLPMQKLRVNEG